MGCEKGRMGMAVGWVGSVFGISICTYACAGLPGAGFEHFRERSSIERSCFLSFALACLLANDTIAQGGPNGGCWTGVHATNR